MNCKSLGLCSMLAVALGGSFEAAFAAEPSQTEVTKPASKAVLFQDKFDRGDLGEQYAVVDSDPNRLVISEGKLMIVGTKPKKNLVLLQKIFPSDFVATVAVKMPLMENNHFALSYRVDERNYLLLGIAGVDKGDTLPWVDACCFWTGRRLFFEKVVEGQANDIVPTMQQLGDRDLNGYTDKPETWYLQLQRDAKKYTGRVSVDGVHWTDVGTHIIVQQHGQIGLSAGSGGGVENAAEFDDLVVQGSP